MDLLKILKKDHAGVKVLLSQIKKAVNEQDIQESRSGFLELKRELTGHSKAEEEILYRSLEKVDDPKTRALGFQSADEHAIVDELLNKMTSLSPADDRWIGAFNVLKNSLELHIKQEESVLFSKSRKFFDKETLAEMGDMFQREKEHVLDGITEERESYREDRQGTSLY